MHGHNMLLGYEQESIIQWWKNGAEIVKCALHDVIIITDWTELSWKRSFLVHYTSNVTSITEVRSASARLFAGMWHPWWVLLQHSIMLQLFFIAECGTMCFLCAVCVLEVWASSSSPWLTLCQISFLSQPPLLS